MEFAKPSEADLKMAMDLCSAFEDLTGWMAMVPAAVEDLGPSIDGETKRDNLQMLGFEPFDREDEEQCTRVLGHLLDLHGRGSLMRVVFGCAVMLDPKNRCVDPQADVIKHHPNALAGLQAQVARPLDEWHEGMGQVLWWSFPVMGQPYLGTPQDAGWSGEHTHWTALIVPEGPPTQVATPPAGAAAARGQPELDPEAEWDPENATFAAKPADKGVCHA